MKPIATLRQKGDGSFELFTTRHTKALVDDIRALTPWDKRSWNGSLKVWRFDGACAPQLKEIAQAHGIKMPAGLENVDASGVEARPNVYIDGDKIVFDFPYTPDMNDHLRSSVPGVAFSGKVYKTAIDNIEVAVNWARFKGLVISTEADRKAREEHARVEAMNAASYALDTDFQVIDGVELHPYQRSGVEQLLKLRRAILGDEMGLGKGLQALTAAVQADAFPLVIVAPNSMKPTWAKVEVAKWFPYLTVQAVSGMSPARLQRTDVIVVNYDILGNRARDILALNPKGLIVDESHYIRNGKANYYCPKCQTKVRSNSKQCNFTHVFPQGPTERWTVKRTEGVMQLARAIPEDGVVFLLTGTPVHNRPTDLIPQLTAVGHLKEFGGPHRFKSYYFPTNTPRHTMELNRKLRATCYVRREKKEVYTTLPELGTSVILMDVDSAEFAKYKEIERDVVHHLASRARQLAEEAGETGTQAYWQKKLRAEAAEHLVRISVLKNAAADMKMRAIQEWISDFLDEEPKLIVFAEHVDVVEALHEQFPGSASVKVRGGVKQAERVEGVERFQTDPECKLFIGNLAAASEGLTLTAASNVAFCELPWNWETVKQAAARCYGRVNDLHGAMAHFLLAEKTIDMDMFRLLDNKRKVSEAINAGIDPESSQSILADLVVALAKRGLGEGTA